MRGVAYKVMSRGSWGEGSLSEGRGGSGVSVCSFEGVDRLCKVLVSGA